MEKSYKLAISALVILVVAISLPTVVGGGGISISYPPGTESLKVPVGVTENTEMHLKNNSGENLLATLRSEGFENVNTNFPDNLILGSDDAKSIVVELSSENTGSFSGNVHISFQTGAKTNGTGGTVVYGFSVPFKGKVLKDIYYNLKVTVEPDIGGTVSVTPSKDKYPTGQEVTLTARPTTGHKFGWWSGDLTGENTQATLIIDSDKQVNAHFIEEVNSSENSGNNGGGSSENVENAGGGGLATFNLNVSVEPTEGGDVNTYGGTYKNGISVHLEATPNQYYSFSDWSGDLSDNSKSVTVVMDSDKAVVANFRKTAYTLTTDNEGEGSVIGGGVYPKGENTEIEAFPRIGWKFVQWRGDINSAKNPATVTVDKPVNVTAVFKEKSNENKSDKSAEISFGSYNSEKFSKSFDSTYTIGEPLAFAVKSDNPITVEVGPTEVKNLDREDNVYYGEVDTSQFGAEGSYLLTVKSNGDVLASKAFTLQAQENGGTPWGYIFAFLFTGIIALVVIVWLLFLRNV